MSRKIFITSLHRSGTQSVHFMLEDAGFRGLHWPASFEDEDLQSKIIARETDFDYVASCLQPAIEANCVLSDVPFPALYDVLFARYPDALFITIARPVREWIKSVRKHVRDDRALDPFERTLYWRYLGHRPMHLSEIGDADMMKVFDQHHRDINSFFKGRGQHFFYDLRHPDAGQRICEFVGIAQRPLPKRDYFTELGLGDTSV